MDTLDKTKEELEEELEAKKREEEEEKEEEEEEEAKKREEDGNNDGKEAEGIEKGIKEEEIEEETELDKLRKELEQQKLELEELKAETLEEKKGLYLSRSIDKYNLNDFKEFLTIDTSDEDYKEQIEEKAKRLNDLINSEVNKRIDEEKKELLKGKGYSPKEGKKEAGKITKEEFDKMSYIEKLKLKKADAELYRSLV